MLIQYFDHGAIDQVKWNRTLREAKNARVYASSWFLDGICEKWGALIAGDYEYIMPLPFRKKWGIEYIYRPAFTQQLGVFSRQAVSKETVDLFLGEVSKRFKYADLVLNSANPVSDNVSLRKNYLLALN